jgi:Lon protease-like protein
MTNFIPIFPLGMVVFPGEQVKLHIFEPRYKQLILECWHTKKSFGIPAVIHNNLFEMGTLVQVNNILAVYEDGKMDIQVTGLHVFKILEQIPSIPDKLYSGAIVSYPHNNDHGNRKLMDMVLTLVEELHKITLVSKAWQKPLAQLNSYDLAHHIGLSLEEEYEFLELMDEMHRQEYLKRFLIGKMATIREIIKKGEVAETIKDFRGFSLN